MKHGDASFVRWGAYPSTFTSRSVAVFKFYQSRFGSFLTRHFGDLFTKPSEKLFLLLAFGFVLSPTRHTIANYLWRAGATAFRHFTRFYVFLGGPFFARLDWLWIAVIKLAEGYVPDGEPLRVRFDETTCKKTGKTIEPADTYRNGAGTARQEWRTLYGVNFVLGEVLIRLAPWPAAFVSVPIGLAVYLKQAKAEALGRRYRRRSELAREMLDRLCGAVSEGRKVRSVQDGNYATRYFLRQLPDEAEVISRLPKNSPLYGEPALKPKGRPGPQAKKGKRLGTALDFAEEETAWRAHPSESGAEVRLVRGLWHSVLPGRVLQVVLVRRNHLRQATSKRRRQRWLEVFFTTALELTLDEILAEYRGRWTIEILIHEARESFGLGQDRCRRYARIEGVNAFRLLIGAAEVLFFAGQVDEAQALDLCRYRSWYRQKQSPSLFDIHWAVREHLYGEGIYPKVGFWETMDELHGPSSGALPRAA